MSETRDRRVRYGEWASPISVEMVARSGIDIGHVALDDGTLYWREQHPTAEGHGAVVRSTAESHEDVTPADVDDRSLVNYGGGDFTVHDDVVFYVDHGDQRVYRQPVDGDPVAITPAPETERGLRYADFEVSDDGRHAYCVREDHDAVHEDGADEPVTTLVRLSTDGGLEPTVVASGHDFYAAPRLSPTGDRLAWLTWDHPGMPWDGTELHVADVAGDVTVENERVVMGGPGESVFQPTWRSDGILHAVSDRTGWWNLYRRQGDEWIPYREESAEYGVPQWFFGLSTYGFLDDGRVAAVVVRDGTQSLELLEVDGSRQVPDLSYASFGGTFTLPRLLSDGSSVYVTASSPTTPPRLVRWEPSTDLEVLRYGSDADVDDGYLSTPEHVTVPTRDGAETHAYVYPPTNPDVEPPVADAPPLVVFAHGGPTGFSGPAFDLDKQFFTSRGFAVADVNYRGSTGYGRAYRESLDGSWGVTDVADCVDVARHLADRGRVDGDRMAVRGHSAGGLVALSALAFHDEFAAATSIAGVTDLERLTEINPKFESSYLDRLVGPYPEASDTYAVRSPVHNVDAIDAPLLLFQGEDDLVVPLSQAESMAEALEARGVPHDLVVLEDEDHFLHRAESRERIHAAELAFYAEVFGIEPAAELPALDLST